MCFWGVLRSVWLVLLVNNDHLCLSRVSVWRPVQADWSGAKYEGCSWASVQAGVGFDQLRMERQRQSGDRGVAAALVLVADPRTEGPRGHPA